MSVDYVVTRFVQFNVGGLKRDLASLSGDFYLLESRIGRAESVAARAAAIGAIGVGVVSTLTTKALMAAGQVERVETGFMTVLKDMQKVKDLSEKVRIFDVKTSFSYLESAKASQMLLASGFRETGAEGGRLMDVMYGVGNAVVAAGKGTDTFVRALAIMGKIKTSGILTGVRVNQFAAAGINVKDILKKQLGLNDEQMINIGRLRLKADIVIPAIVKGMNEQFGGGIEAAAKTYLGSLEILKGSSDKLLASIGKAIGKDATNFIKSLSGMANAVEGFVKTHPRLTAMLLKLTAVGSIASLFFGIYKMIQISKLATAAMTATVARNTTTYAGNTMAVNANTVALSRNAAASRSVAIANGMAGVGGMPVMSSAARIKNAANPGAAAARANLLANGVGMAVPMTSIKLRSAENAASSAYKASLNTQRAVRRAEQALAAATLAQTAATTATTRTRTALGLSEGVKGRAIQQAIIAEQIAIDRTIAARTALDRSMAAAAAANTRAAEATIAATALAPKAGAAGAAVSTVTAAGAGAAGSSAANSAAGGAAGAASVGLLGRIRNGIVGLAANIKSAPARPIAPGGMSVVPGMAEKIAANRAAIEAGIKTRGYTSGADRAALKMIEAAEMRAATALEAEKALAQTWKSGLTRTSWAQVGGTALKVGGSALGGAAAGYGAYEDYSKVGDPNAAAKGIGTGVAAAAVAMFVPGGAVAVALSSGFAMVFNKLVNEPMERKAERGSGLSEKTLEEQKGKDRYDRAQDYFKLADKKNKQADAITNQWLFAFNHVDAQKAENLKQEAAMALAEGQKQQRYGLQDRKEKARLADEASDLQKREQMLAKMKADRTPNPLTVDDSYTRIDRRSEEEGSAANSREVSSTSSRNGTNRVVIQSVVTIPQRPADVRAKGTRYRANTM